jgi:hypothetical protein
LSLADTYRLFVAERLAPGLFIGGILLAANAMVALSFDRGDRGATLGTTSSATFLGHSPDLL